VVPMGGNGGAPEHLAKPLYSYSESDHLAGATKGTTHRWIEGYSYVRNGERIYQPPVTPGTGGLRSASFLDLLEVVVIARLKERGFSLGDVRQIVINCQEILGIQRPLVRAKFKTDGKEIFVEKGSTLVEIHKRKYSVAWNEILAPFLEQLDYADEWAERWWPLGKATPIVIDPDYGFGLPVIAGSGIRTEIILERIRAGDLPDQVADDFNVSPIEVNRAIQFEMTRAA
jgi:uncharacterized protein (DUF433 family)